MMQTLMDWTLHIYRTFNSVFVNVQRWKKRSLPKDECNTTETAFRITLQSPSGSFFCTVTYITRQSRAVRVASDSVIVQKQHVIHQIAFHTKQSLYLNPFGQFIQFQACHFVQAGH